jgi:hypothetical protein
VSQGATRTLRLPRSPRRWGNSSALWRVTLVGTPARLSLVGPPRTYPAANRVPMVTGPTREACVPPGHRDLATRRWASVRWRRHPQDTRGGGLVDQPTALRQSGNRRTGDSRPPRNSRSVLTVLVSFVRDNAPRSNLMTCSFSEAPLTGSMGSPSRPYGPPRSLYRSQKSRGSQIHSSGLGLVTIAPGDQASSPSTRVCFRSHSHSLIAATSTVAW